MITVDRIIRSARRTAAIQIKNNEVIVRAPQAMTNTQIACFVAERTDWIEKHLAMAEEAKATTPESEPLIMEELRALADKARKVIPERVRCISA